MENEACIETLMWITRLLRFATSDEGRVLFGILVTVKALIYFLGRSTLPEANELGSTLLTVLTVILLLIANEGKLQERAATLKKCKMFDISAYLVQSYNKR